MAIISVKKGTSIIELPAPSTISVGSEIIWSANTGRTSTGKMVGDVIAEKDTLQITWEYLVTSEKNKIKDNLSPGFFTLKINIDGTDEEITVYRGTLTSEAIGQLSDGLFYYRSVSVDIVEQ